jgi:hypothetical protein
LECTKHHDRTLILIAGCGVVLGHLAGEGYLGFSQRELSAVAMGPGSDRSSLHR